MLETHAVMLWEGSAVTGEFRLGVDFGSSNTIAVLAWPDGTVKPLLFDGSEVLPSAVLAESPERILVGRDALHAARTRPECFEPSPKRAIDDGTVLLGNTEIPVANLIAAVLARVADEARRVAGYQVNSVTLTHPAGWGRQRQEILFRSAQQAGLGVPRLVAEPVAAAASFVRFAKTSVPMGQTAVVYDFGAGTFDASVVRRTESGFEVLAERGISNAGGLDIDAAVVAYLGSVYASRDHQTWNRLLQPRTSADRRATRGLWEDVRIAKEVLSRQASTLVFVPLFDDDAPLGRIQIEQLARPVVESTIRATRTVIREAGTTPQATSGIFLVGGSSRMPLVASLLQHRLGIAPHVLDRPEHVVAEGCLLVEQTTQPIQTLIPSSLMPSSSSPPTFMPASTPGPLWVQQPLVMEPLASVSPLASVTPVEVAPFEGFPGSGYVPALAGALPFSPLWPVQIVEVHLPNRTGYSLRTELDEERSLLLAEAGRWLLFEQLPDLLAYVINRSDHAFARLDRWAEQRDYLLRVAPRLTGDDIYDFDLIMENLTGTVDQLVPRMLISCRDLAGEVADQLALTTILEIMAPDTYLDRFDDVLRDLDGRVLPGKGRRKLHGYDYQQLMLLWNEIIQVLERAAEFR